MSYDEEDHTDSSRTVTEVLEASGALLKAEVIGFVPVLERLAVREISDRFPLQDERIEIADLCHAALSIRHVADRLGRAPRQCRGSCAATRPRLRATGHSKPNAARRRGEARHHRRRFEITPELGQLVAELLAQRWSPQQISRPRQDLTSDFAPGGGCAGFGMAGR